MLTFTVQQLDRDTRDVTIYGHHLWTLRISRGLFFRVPLRRWFEKRRTALEGVGSTLEFQLARLRFLRFLKVGFPTQHDAAGAVMGRMPHACVCGVSCVGGV